MKKILLCLLALAAGLTAFGQNESSFGVRAGLNVANLHLSAGGLSASLDSRASYHVGFAYQQPVLRVLPLYFETGLYLSGRGASVNGGRSGFRRGRKGQIQYVIPAGSGCGELALQY